MNLLNSKRAYFYPGKAYLAQLNIQILTCESWPSGSIVLCFSGAFVIIYLAITIKTSRMKTRSS